MSTEFADEVTSRVASGEEGRDEQSFIEFHGEEYGFYEPTTAQMAYMAMAINGDNLNVMRQVGMAINFLVNLMDEDDAARFRSVLLDRRSGVEDDEILDLYEDLTERWSSRPTESPSGSSRSAQRTGRRSTDTSPSAERPQRSTSRRAGSATSRSRS